MYITLSQKTHNPLTIASELLLGANSRIHRKTTCLRLRSLLLFCCIIWSALSQSFSNLLASRIVAAFAGSSTEALGAAIVSVSVSSLKPSPSELTGFQDIFYLHERGMKMGIYIIFLYCGNSVGSLLAGFIIERAGWRWFCWFCAIISGLKFLAIFIFVHETRFNGIPPEIASTPETISIQESGSSEKGILAGQVEKVNSSSSSAELSGTKKTLLHQCRQWCG